MGALIPSDRGFIADARQTRLEKRHRPVGRGLIVCACILFAFVLAVLFVPRDLTIGPVDSKDVKGVPTNNSYQFRVYALNQTSIQTSENGTRFSFCVGDLPFGLCSLQFGDFRKDTNYSLRYYGGSGILVSACGENATMAIRESTGRLISKVQYHGQGLIVLSGETQYCSYPSGVTWNGTDAMVQDWRTGSWTPDDGILIEHPKNVTLSNAKFYVMVFDPAGNVLVPEYEVVPVIAMTLLLVAFLRDRRVGQEPKDITNLTRVGVVYSSPRNAQWILGCCKRFCRLPRSRFNR